MPGASPRSLSNTLIHPLARMLPILRFQLQVYRLGEKNPPSGSMLGHSPHWSVTQLLLDPMASTQVRINVQPDFHWLATTASGRIQAPMTIPITQIYAPSGPNTLVFPGDFSQLTIGDDITFAGLTLASQLNGQTREILLNALGNSSAASITPEGLSVFQPNNGLNLTDTLVPETGRISTERVVTTPGNYRAQIYDTRKGLRMADRGVRVANLGGDTHGVHWFRDPYVFDLPNSQVLLIVQNLESAPNEIQVNLYGQVLRHNQIAGTP